MCVWYSVGDLSSSEATNTAKLRLLKLSSSGFFTLHVATEQSSCSDLSSKLTSDQRQMFLLKSCFLHTQVSSGLRSLSVIRASPGCVVHPPGVFRCSDVSEGTIRRHQGKSNESGGGPSGWGTALELLSLWLHAASLADQSRSDGQSP